MFNPTVFNSDGNPKYGLLYTDGGNSNKTFLLIEDISTKYTQKYAAKHLGMIYFTKNTDYQQINGDVWQVRRVFANKGMGSYMYEVAMSTISPNWLTSDFAVSQSAIPIWRKYSHRSDVDKIKIHGKRINSVNEFDNSLYYGFKLKTPTIDINQMLNNGNLITGGDEKLINRLWIYGNTEWSKVTLD